jgi:hypothetical protein
MRVVHDTYNAFDDTFMVEEVVRSHFFQGISNGFLAEWTANFLHGVQRPT